MVSVAVKVICKYCSILFWCALNPSLKYCFNYMSRLLFLDWMSFQLCVLLWLWYGTYILGEELVLNVTTSPKIHYHVPCLHLCILSYLLTWSILISSRKSQCPAQHNSHDLSAKVAVIFFHLHCIWLGQKIFFSFLSTFPNTPENMLTVSFSET